MQIKNSIILVISGAGFNDMITKDFPLNFLFARNPGKVVGKVDNMEIIYQYLVTL